MTLSCEVVRTRNGLTAMRDRISGEVMHPVGPLHEARQLYVAASQLERRLQAQSAEPAAAAAAPLVLLDVGLGAGSNAGAAFFVSQRRARAGRPLEIVSFDRSLAALSLAIGDEHCAAFGLEGEAGEAARALLAHGQYRAPRTSWRLRLGELPHTLRLEPPASADVVFWDPFSPRADASLWTAAAFAELRRVCRTGATVHTYSGATGTRSALLLAGFAVGIGDEVSPGKFSTCAALSIDDLARPLDRRWLERLARSSAPFPSDAPDDALARLRTLPQFSS